METKKDMKLPAILKFSNLAWVLPYFGRIYRWKWLLQFLNKRTKELWAENLAAFINLGLDMKEEMLIEDESDRIIPYIWKDIHSQFFWKLLVRSTNVAKILIKILQSLEGNKTVILEYYRTIKLFISQYISHKIFQGNEWTYKLIICNDNEIRNLIPTMNCPNARIKNLNFQNNEQNKLIEFIQNSLGYKTASIKSGVNSINMTLNYSSTVFMALDFTESIVRQENIRNKYDFWDINEWICRPHTLVLEFMWIERFPNFLAKFNFLKNVKLLWISNCYLKNSEELNNLLSIFSVNSEIKIQTEYFELFDDFQSGSDDSSSADEEKVKYDDITFNSKTFYFIANQKIFKVETDSVQVECTGIIVDNPWKKSNLLLVKLEGFVSLNSVITTYSNFSSDFFFAETLNKPILSKTSWYIILDKKDIKEILFANTKSLKLFANWSYIKNIVLNFNKEEINKTEIFESLLILPKSTSLSLKISSKSYWILKIEEFWRYLVQFKSIKFIPPRSEKYSIIFNSSKSLNEVDIFSSEITIAKSNSTELSSISKLIDQLTSNEIEPTNDCDSEFSESSNMIIIP